jgi:AcrR family transcriptional regulator
VHSELQSALQPRESSPSLNTRDRILAASLRVFNDEGLSKVSLSRIALELDMSAGNLHYHFRNKEDIADALIRHLEKDMDALAGNEQPIEALDDWCRALHLSFEVIYTYRFVYREIDYLLRKFPRLAPRARRLTQQNLEVTRRRCTKLAAEGVLRATKEEIDSLAFQMVLTATCWLTFTNIMSAEANPGIATYHVLTILGPYLSEESRPYLDYLHNKHLSHGQRK